MRRGGDVDGGGDGIGCGPGKVGDIDAGVDDRHVSKRGIDGARSLAAEAEIGNEAVDDGEIDAFQDGVERGGFAVVTSDARAALRKDDCGGCELPFAAGAGGNGGRGKAEIDAVEGAGGIGDGAFRGQPGLGGDVERRCGVAIGD